MVLIMMQKDEMIEVASKIMHPQITKKAYAGNILISFT